MAMTFREATDILLGELSHERLAEKLGVSVPTVRQARLGDDAKAHRSPPEGWEEVVAGIAEERGYALLKLAKSLDRQRIKAAKSLKTTQK